MTSPEHLDRDAHQALVERAQRGDQNALRALWNDHRRWVAAIVLAHRPRTIDVEDLMQEVAIKLISRIDSLRDAAAFRPWLRRIIINICRGAARRERPMLSLAGSNPNSDDERGPGSFQLASPETGPAQTVGSRDAADLVYEHALGLPPEYREPLLLRCVRGMSYRQISALLDLPVTTIETRLARARRMIRTELDSSLDGDAAEECA